MRNPSVVLRICAAIVLALGLASIGTAQNREKFVISAKAGGVNSVTGRVMVTRAGKSQLLTAQDDLTAGDLVTTGAASQVEVLLNPGSYLRVSENSAFEFADNSLENIRVRLVKGSAIVEAMGLDDTELHITIVTEQARVVVARRGVYRINAAADSTELLVRKGRALINDNPRNFIKGGNEVVFRGGSFLATKLGKRQQDQFDDWSKERANTLAKANERLSARGLNTYLASFNSFEWAFSAANPYGLWAFSPFSRCFTFLPFYYGWSSPYGHNYGLYYGIYDYWPGRGCCGDIVRGPVIVFSNPSSSGGSLGGSSGGSSGGSIGNSRPPSPPPPPAGPPPSQAGPRDPDSGGRSINRIKDPIN
ncbi:MAG TPA: FecR family protein [Pyrinomonadaceae bacterium]|nr:FecR family protein [Pyrinomonadaceae bacterium]